jgi:hypothetical protein
VGELHALSDAYGDSCAARVLHLGCPRRANYGRSRGSDSTSGQVVLLRIPNLSDESYRLFEIVGYSAHWRGFRVDR